MTKEGRRKRGTISRVLLVKALFQQRNSIAADAKSGHPIITNDHSKSRKIAHYSRHHGVIFLVVVVFIIIINNSY